MKYLGIIMCLIVLASCKKNQDLTKVEETLYVRNDGADMPVYIRGNVKSKVIILVVHGGPGGNGLEYRSGNYTVDLESKYAMAYWDQRGQGMSQGNFSESKVNIETMVEDMNAVVLTLKAKYGNDVSVFAMGHSWGGTLSAKYMITKEYQHNLNGWIEADGAHDIPKLNKDAITMFKTVAQEQIQAGNNVSNWQGILDWANGIDINNITVEQGGEINSNGQSVEGWLQSDGVISSGESGGNTNSMFFGPTNPLTSSVIGGQTNQNLNEIEFISMTDELYKVTIPTLVLWGKYDFVVPPSLGVDTYNNISSTDKKIVIFEESGHSPMSNEWRKYTDEMIAFVDLYK